MNKIKVLPDNLANQIAAGEVVERPASVVKELIENAIDAGGTRIQIDIELGGRRLIAISDDGEGMSRDDAILSFERHATSKIRTLEDLSHIGTLGFRGEALASVASVAKVDLLTKTANDEMATRVVVEGGKLIDVKDAARNTGTTISVRDLFFNTPARRKFMRSEATENYHLTNIVQHYALAHPEVGFRLTNNGREIIRASPAKDLRERGFQLFGPNLLESLLPVSGGRDFVAKISGFISAPRERRTTRDSQYFFVNNRFVRDKTISGGLLEGFRSVLPHGVYPVAFLFLDIPVEEIDVNVHPAKTEIRFRRGEAVKDVIAEAVRNTLAKAGIVPEIIQESRAVLETNTESTNSEISVAASAEQVSIAFSPTLDQSPAFTEGLTKPIENRVKNRVPTETEVSIPFFPLGDSDLNEQTQAESWPTDVPRDEVDSVTAPPAIFPPVNSAERFVKTEDVPAASSGKIHPIGQLHESFIIATDSEGLLLIDQHVAHERILFDKFKLRGSEQSVESQNLLLPETIDLTPAQGEIFHLIEDDLASLGFGVIRLSGRTIAIKSVPADIAPSEARNLFAEILDAIGVGRRGNAKASMRDEVAASLACKAAIKINMKLTHEKMQWLIDRLLVTTSPTTCPHGRPIILRLTMKDIERGFHRT
jgi:DNA mismatch repair protein MutL